VIPYQSSKACRGFTLLEVLVALTIVGLGVVTLLQIFSLGLRLQTRSQFQSDAIAQGARVMDELLARRNLSEGADNGKLARGGRWSAQVQTMREPPTSLGLSKNWELREIALEMIVRDGERERQLDLQTLRLARKAQR
jgi:prepilin-type N-terminal cleavage/methylation domain-containing protein